MCAETAKAVLAREEIATLLEAAGAGCAASLGKLYNRTRSALFSVIVRLINDRSESEDIVHDVYLIVWRKAADFGRSITSPMTWLITIAHNRAIDWLRRMSVRRTATLGFAPPIADPSPLADILIEQSEEISGIIAALATLTATHAACIRSIYHDDLSYTELSRRDHIPPGTLKSWVRRGVMRVRSSLEVPTVYPSPT